MALGLVLNRTRQVPAEHSPAFGAIAERFRRAGECERAVRLCQEGLQRYPTHLSARVTLGWALIDLGRCGEARLELERVLKLAPDNLAAIRGLAELHDRTDGEAALGVWPPPPDPQDAAAAPAVGPVADAASLDVVDVGGSAEIADAAEAEDGLSFAVEDMVAIVDSDDRMRFDPSVLDAVIDDSLTLPPVNTPEGFLVRVRARQAEILAQLAG